MQGPARAHVLDKLIGGALPRFESMAQVAAFEASAPYAERVAAHSTYQALQLGAAIDPQAPALHFLQHASPDETPLTLTHGEWLQRVTQAANAFHALGVGRGEVVSLLLPLLPQAFVALFGAQAVGVANPVNPMLSAGQIADILRAAGTRVLVTIGPTEGTDLWDKVTAVRYAVPTLKTVLVVGGAAHPGLDADDFDAHLDAQPATHLSSGRLPADDDAAGYFHTGGTTGTPKLVRHTHANQVSQAWALRLMGLAGPGQGLLFGLP
ncbi:MAG TPA: AMP-binding protein, partial [Burkholderiaceae bacterium]